MKKVMYNFFSLTLIVTLFVAQLLHAEEGKNGNLVTVQWLNKNINKNDLVLIDASPGPIYSTKHISGAVNHDIFSYGAREMPLNEIETRYQSWGISPGKTIVIYDQGGTYLATRLFFSFEYYGYPVSNIFILDGGLAKWQEAGYAVTSEPIMPPQKGSFTIKNLHKEVRADLPEFLTASGNTAENVLIDALDPNWHFGGLNLFGRPGHIPNSILLPAADFFNLDKTFKSAEEIKKIVNYVGIKPEQTIYTHCGGGIAASVPYFAIKYLVQYSDVKLYPGSQLEWASDQRELPFWTYDAPFLLREATWLQGWGSKMMRMYGVTQISMIDVRSADAFRQGHLPFALNVPVDEFKKNLSSPNMMADVLRDAGVNSAHEAVIISGEGITKEAALAFVLLEKLGHKKISIFLDSKSKWEQLGFKIQKETVATNEKKLVRNDGKSSATYSSDIRTDVVITDVKSTNGLFPKIYIASGKNIPVQRKDGNVIHVPYTELLNENGTPRAAKDIWNILNKAGVPRYAELVCFSDDPSEAAVNYFILKLMGYPDIKVLVN
jgi:3-mercaptopyruvate sulfurtransferase SseA